VEKPIHVYMALTALACWLVTLRKLVDLRRNPRLVVLRHMCLAQISLSLAISVQPFAHEINRIAGVLDTSRIISNTMTMVAAGNGLAVGLYSAYPEPLARSVVRRCMRTLVACVVASVVLFLTVRPPYALTDPHVTSDDYYAFTPSLTEVPYTLVYVGFLVPALVGVIVVAHRNRSQIPFCPPIVVLGVETMLAGAFMGIGYSVAKAVDAVLATGGGALPYAQPFIAVLFTGAIVAVLGGLAIPVVGPHFGLDRLSDDLAARRSCRRLLPLWRLVHAASPQIALLPHPSSPVLRKVRLTVEILDGCAALAPWMVPEPEAAPEHLDDIAPDDRDAVVEATALAEAARRKLDGMPGTDRGLTASTRPAGHASSAAEQVDWLERVSQALETSPAIAAATFRATPLVVEESGVPVAGR
jgi:hypothetical protein